MRRTVLRIHLLLSLTFGLFFVATCTSGSLLLIETDVEHMLHPLDHKASQGQIQLADIQQQAKKTYPDYKINSIEYPLADDMYHINISKTTGKEAQTVYADPGSGELFGKVQKDRLEPFATIYQLHRYFLLLPIIGKTGAATVVGLLGVALTLVLVTGAYLWWPGIRKMAVGFKVIFNRGKYIQNMSLHKVIGIISIPILLLAALTGFINAFEKQIPVWFHFSAREIVPASALQSTSKEGAQLTMDQVIAQVKDKFADSKIIKITPPAKQGQSYQIGVKEGFGASRGSNSTIYMDASSGTVLYKTNPSLAINTYNTWRKGLHFATWGGEITKIITFIFGMMPLVLMITGLAMWRIKAKARKRSTKSASSPVAVAS